jgi:hypothetical protein
MIIQGPSTAAVNLNLDQLNSQATQTSLPRALNYPGKTWVHRRKTSLSKARGGGGGVDQNKPARLRASSVDLIGYEQKIGQLRWQNGTKITIYGSGATSSARIPLYADERPRMLSV